MDNLKRLFGGLTMTWKKVILFALAAGAYTGAINLIPFLKDTSFQDIAITTEWWVLFAVIIAVNCPTPGEAGIKVFVFFLISQPLVYLIETPFIGVGVWRYYRYWAIITLLTLPGGMVANLIRRKNLLGALVTTAGLILIALSASEYALRTLTGFPRHLLTVLFCLLEMAAFIAFLIPRKPYRVMAAVVALTACIGFGWLSLSVQNTIDAPLPEGEGWVCTFEQPDRSLLTTDGHSVTLTYTKSLVKRNVILCTDQSGQTIRYAVELNRDRTVELIQE